MAHGSPGRESESERAVLSPPAPPPPPLPCLDGVRVTTLPVARDSGREMRRYWEVMSSESGRSPRPRHARLGLGMHMQVPGGPCSAEWPCWRSPSATISRQHTIFSTRRRLRATRRANQQAFDAPSPPLSPPAAAPDSCRRTRELPRHPHAADVLNFNVTSPLSP